MSTATMAVGPNPAVMNGPSLVLDSKSKLIHRQRISTIEKKSNGETFSKQEFSEPQGNKGFQGRDLRDMGNGDAAFDGQKELSRARKDFVNPILSPRKRKAVPKPGKPTWKRILSIITKFLILIVVLFLLGQKIQHWDAKHRNLMISTDGLLDIEGRVSEVEALFKSTSKMMQAQVDVVDKKIENEIGSLRREMTKKVEEKGAAVGSQLKQLGDRTDSLHRSLDDLLDAGFLKKEEFDAFLNALKESQQEDGKDLNLDNIRLLAREIVEKEIEKHAADGLGMVDYALASGGGRVVKHSEPFLLDKAGSWIPVGKSRIGVHSTAHKMLEPSFGEPGQCFALKGSAGFVVIRLRTAIIPEAVTLEHVAKSVAYDRKSAPKDCRVLAWFQGHGEDAAGEADDKGLLLTEFTYDLEKSNAQTFSVGVADLDAAIVDTIRLDFTSNHGNSQHTCIYRFRVHGHESGSLATLEM